MAAENAENPIKPRLVITSPKSSNKPLSQAITPAFRLFYIQIKPYSSKWRFFAGVDSFWVVQSNKSVLRTINKVYSRNAAKSINTFDFSAWYTSFASL